MDIAKLQLVRENLTPTPENPFWNISPAVGLFMKNLVIKYGLKNILEVGTSNGYSALWLSEAVVSTGGHVYTVESHHERFSIAANNFREAQVVDLVSQIKGHAPEAFALFDQNAKWDFAFFDATKFEYGDYLNSVLPRLNKGAIILADNVRSHYSEMQNFFNKANDLRENYDILYSPKLGTGMVVIATGYDNLSAELERLSSTSWEQLIP